MPYRTIKYSKKGHIATIKLGQLAGVNSRELAGELEEVIGRINDDNNVYVVVVTGTGKTFANIKETNAGAAAAIAAIERPVIAAINGDALGEGLEIALSCDIRIASEKAHFAMPQVTNGCLPRDGGTQRLPRIIGRGKAMEMLLSAKTLSAAEALEIGLVSRIVPPSKLKEETCKLAESIAARGPIALRYLKEAVNKGMDLKLEQGLRLEADLYFLLHTTADRTEGITAFREKRKPEFKGK
jgi:enoyl-CoA hydratase/carnithine racemase